MDKLVQSKVNAEYSQLYEYYRNNEKCSERVQQLRNYIVSCRSYLDFTFLNTGDPVFKLAEFSNAECGLLYKELSSNFDISNSAKHNTVPSICSGINAIRGLHCLSLRLDQEYHHKYLSLIHI